MYKLKVSQSAESVSQATLGPDVQSLYIFYSDSEDQPGPAWASLHCHNVCRISRPALGVDCSSTEPSQFHFLREIQQAGTPALLLAGVKYNNNIPRMTGHNQIQQTIMMMMMRM